MATSYIIIGVINTIFFLFIIAGVATDRVDKVSWTLLFVIGGLVISKASGLLTSWEQLYSYIDSQLLISIIGITMVLAVLDRSGVLQLLTIAILRKTSSDFSSLVWILSILVLILSFLISNILAFIIVASITILIANSAEFNPKPLLFLELVVSNLGSILTPIASYTATYISLTFGWDYPDFLILSTPFVIPTLFITVWFTKIYFRKEFNELKEKHLNSYLSGLIRSFDPMTFINRRLIRRAMFIFITVLMLLIFGHYIGISIDIALLTGLALVLIVCPNDSESILKNDVDWKLLFFLSGIFIISGLINDSQLMTLAFKPFIQFTDQSPSIGIVVIVWVLGIVTIAVENLPMIFLFKPTLISLPHQTALWWGILAATHLTDSVLLISSVKGVILSDMLRKEGTPVKFFSYLKYGLSITLIHYILFSLYILLLIKID